MKKKILSLSFIIIYLSLNVNAQTIFPDLGQKESWSLINRTASDINENGKKGISYGL